MKNGNFQIRNEWNPDVPVETLLRNEVKENKRLHQMIGELESEILHLNNIIGRRNQAISDFKKWQLSIAKLKINDWLSKARNLTESQEELERLNLIKSAVRSHKLFESMLVKLERAYSMFMESMNKLDGKGGEE